MDDFIENPDSLNSAIKGITEETAGIIAGQIARIRIIQAETNDIIRQQFEQIKKGNN